MAMKSESEWIDAYAELEKVSDDSWMENLSSYIEDMTTGMTLDGFTPAPVFTFSKSDFKSSLITADPNAIGSGVLALQTAFSVSIASSTMLVSAGTITGAGTPAEIYSVVATTLPEPTSVTAGGLTIAELSSAPKTADPKESQFPKKLYAAFAGLMYICTGTNSVTPTPSPLVLTAGVI